MSTATPGVRFEEVWKLFGEETPAVANLNLDIQEGEFLVLVGPSGCGKTTSLRMLAGLERPSYGRIWFGDRDVTTLAPGDRDVAMVFQSYALYPNMSVYRNLAFGPTVRGETKGDLRKRIDEVAEILGIGSLLKRRPTELSGGQRQRVALGRALLRESELFLLDEPLSNLDAALRVQMRAELIRLHKRLTHTTSVYVTHDQIEALTMGDRVAVLKDGHLLQCATPSGLYENPANSFVATFIGSPKMNLLSRASSPAWGRSRPSSCSARPSPCIPFRPRPCGPTAPTASFRSGCARSTCVRPAMWPAPPTPGICRAWSMWSSTPAVRSSPQCASPTSWCPRGSPAPWSPRPGIGSSWHSIQATCTSSPRRAANG